jgi:hypothetical protein
MGKPRCVVTGVLICTALALGTACGSSAPEAAPDKSSTSAAAEPGPSPAKREANELSGVYQIAYADGSVETWIVEPCGPGCAKVDQNQFGLTKSTISGQAHLKDTTWELIVQRTDAVTCEDGSQYEGSSTWTWDATTLEGMLTGSQFTDACGKAAGSELEKVKFTLTKQSSGVPKPGFQTS